MLLERHHQLHAGDYLGLRYYHKAGLRYDPASHPGMGLFFSHADLQAAHLIDASDSLGLLSLYAAAQRVTLLASSSAVLRCAQQSLAEQNKAVDLCAGAWWDVPAESADCLCALPSSDKGHTRVVAELQAAQRALQAEGRAYLLMHKDQGAKRYEKLARGLFGSLEVVAKRGGWRLSCARKLEPSLQNLTNSLHFQAAGLQLYAEAGVFAAGKLDPGTALLLEHFPQDTLLGKRVLDMGCGYGLLALKASLAAAEVTALDDDLLAVRSSYHNARHYGLDVRCLHSDINAALAADERFDVVLMNPPFHLAKQVDLALPRAFIAAAHNHLVPGGKLVLVANQALPYERDLASWQQQGELGRNAQFKVLWAQT